MKKDPTVEWMQLYRALHGCDGATAAQAYQTIQRARASATNERGRLHLRALNYQAAHPGSDYLDALRALHQAGMSAA